MKIITWNCNMAFRKKAALILAHQPDILVVQECEQPGKMVFDYDVPQPEDTLWFGHNPNKGIGIFSYGTFRLKLLDTYDDNLKMIIPVEISDGKYTFTLFAIWANHPADPDGAYITQVWKALHHYDALITSRRTLLIGDFNSNTIWDRPKRAGNHSTVVKQLADKGIESLYHQHFKQVQGSEQHPTLFMYRHKGKPYHIDYCFASSDMRDHLESVEVGDFDGWRHYSDHVPLMVTFHSSLCE